jgi:hypothetical protein
MSAANIIRAKVWEDGGATIQARITKAGSNIAQATLSTITYGVWDVTDPDSPTVTVAAGQSVTIASTVFDTLQTGSGWDRDGTGFNFQHTLPATSFPTGGKTYRVEYKFTPASGQVWWVVAELEARAVHTS